MKAFTLAILGVLSLLFSLAALGYFWWMAVQFGALAAGAGSARSHYEETATLYQWIGVLSASGGFLTAVYFFYRLWRIDRDIGRNP